MRAEADKQMDEAKEIRGQALKTRDEAESVLKEAGEAKTMSRE